MKCQIKGCPREVEVVRHELCQPHYKRFQRAKPKTQAAVRAWLEDQQQQPLPRRQFRFPAAAGARA